MSKFLRFVRTGSLAAFALALSTVAVAQQEQNLPDTYQGQERQFREMDNNTDGVLTPDEIDPDLTLVKEFDRFDADGNGTIELDEFYDYLKSQGAKQ